MLGVCLCATAVNARPSKLVLPLQPSEVVKCKQSSSSPDPAGLRKDSTGFSTAVPVQCGCAYLSTELPLPRRNLRFGTYHKLVFVCLVSNAMLATLAIAGAPRTLLLQYAGLIDAYTQLQQSCIKSLHAECCSCSCMLPVLLRQLTKCCCTKQLGHHRSCIPYGWCNATLLAVTVSC